MKFSQKSVAAYTLFATHLDTLVPEHESKRIVLDNLNWDELEFIAKEAYTSEFYQEAPNPRIMMGMFVYSCLADKTYRELEEDFSYNAVCQYACGFTEMKQRTLDHTTIIKFEQNLGEENILKIKDMIEMACIKKTPPRSKGSHSFDTTVFESNVTYPTDTKLMEQVRKFLVEVITTHQKRVKQNHRHYGRVAKAEYVGFCKKRKPTKKIIKKMKKSQLQYLRRNINQAEEVINALIKIVETKLDKKQSKKLKTKLEISKKIYEQQRALYEGEKIKNRIVSFYRPEVRPIFRGKTKQSTEFGVKTGMTIQGKTLTLGKKSYNNFYDGHGLKETIMVLRNKGHPVKEMIGDKGNQGCQRFLKQENIKNGLERRGKQEKSKNIPKKRFLRERNKMEGAFGTIKNVFGLMKMRAKTEFGDQVKILKACIGYNLKYAF